MKIPQSYTDCQGVNTLTVSIRLNPILIPIQFYSFIRTSMLRPIIIVLQLLD